MLIFLLYDEGNEKRIAKGISRSTALSRKRTKSTARRTAYEMKTSPRAFNP
ncbi:MULTISPECIES: hypothetical protein [Avibacterium]|uniref:Uncharacterized protein n=1 Tax=Avibacterium paragallinarum TaxID=728 RepID=A0ABU7QIM1_AVIPA|nr:MULTISPECIES: hypothetical protein [Avibacterium]MEE3609218.1 hypothetical protein [Avibacterium paragallinarum]MEE3620764.1 hypothetical protein [Avibacterium paragallinarum]MEE3668508.1 hypothetical protein [Avibacterium paragallinarum]MEE4386536.1 hypothetical protein [Avibacterium paragallinarum]QIR10845.1 hypothetical protein HBL79_00370 [Avibacterium paragallinarum]